jgi:hypothetical protein
MENFRWKINPSGASLGFDPIFRDRNPGIEKNVQLLARNRVVTAMASPDRIPGRWTQKKMLATAAAAR